MPGAGGCRSGVQWQRAADLSCAGAVEGGPGQQPHLPCCCATSDHHTLGTESAAASPYLHMTMDTEMSFPGPVIVPSVFDPTP